MCFWLIFIMIRIWAEWINAYLDEIWVICNLICNTSQTHFRLQRYASPQVEMDHKQAIVLQNLLHYAVFLHREVDLTGTQIKENVCSYFQCNLKHRCEEIREAVSQNRPDSEPDWMLAFHVKHTSAQFSQSHTSRYLKICRENNS